MSRATTTETATGTDTEYLFCTKSVRIPRGKIQGVRPTPDGCGAMVITDRGATRVLEPYEQIMVQLYGSLDGASGEEVR